MKSRFLLIFAALSVMATGCVIDNPAAYDPCKTAKDCSGALADVCITLTQNWPGGTAIESICTSKVCSSDTGCSLSANGNRGYCSLNSIMGAPANTCFERCYYDGDCSPGFVCAGSKDVAGLPSSEQICVPKGSGGVVSSKDTYTTCTVASQCTGGTMLCEELNPKWDNTIDSFALSICTINCVTDNNCPNSANGELGYCAQMSDVSNMTVCVERCNVQGDCRPGFLCAPMSTVTGLPENASDSICLPDPKYAP